MRSSRGRSDVGWLASRLGCRFACRQGAGRQRVWSYHSDAGGAGESVGSGRCGLAAEQDAHRGAGILELLVAGRAPADDVAVETGLRQSHDKVSQAANAHGRGQLAPIHLVLEDAGKGVHGTVVQRRLGGGENAQGVLRVLADKALQGLGVQQGSVDVAVDAHHIVDALARGSGLGLLAQFVVQGPQRLAQQLVFAADPAEQGGPSDVEFRRQFGQVNAAAFDPVAAGTADGIGRGHPGRGWLLGHANLLLDVAGIVATTARRRHGGTWRDGFVKSGTYTVFRVPPRKPVRDNMSRTVLIIEDNPGIAQLVRMHVEDLGMTAVHEPRGDSGLARYRAGGVDLVVLDLMLPGLDGLSVCREIRQDSGYVPILMLTAKTTELDRVLGLEMGADDYLTKPFSVAELAARIKALFRRVDALSVTAEPETASDVIDSDGLHIDPARRKVRIADAEVDLTAREFDLLLHFARHPGRVFSRAQLLDAVWGYNHEGYEHTVNTHINRLRNKIECDPAKPDFIQTVWGVGYRFRD